MYLKTCQTISQTTWVLIDAVRNSCYNNIATLKPYSNHWYSN
nr:MAG TPA: hypothetical protein [Caudoviricetes sp.]